MGRGKKEQNGPIRLQSSKKQVDLIGQLFPRHQRWRRLILSRPAAEVTDVVVEIVEPLEMQLATSLMGRIAKVTPQGQRRGVEQG